MKKTEKKTVLNDVARRAIHDRLIRAISDEKLTTNEAAALLGLRANYISMIKSVNQWRKCPISAWEAARRWTNSGESLKKYGEKIHLSSGETLTRVKNEPAYGDKPAKEPIVWEAVDDKEVSVKKEEKVKEAVDKATSEVKGAVFVGDQAIYKMTEEGVKEEADQEVPERKEGDDKASDLLLKILKDHAKNKSIKNKITIAATILIAWFFIWTIVGVHTVNDNLHIVGKMLLDGFLAIVFSALWIWVRTWIMTTKWKLW